jgi:hypothetical protein
MGRSVTIPLPREDWEEMYYALESKIKSIQAGDYGKEDEPGQDRKWIAHMKAIMKKLEKHLDV